MARISTYLKDSGFNNRDIVIGSDYISGSPGNETYQTANFKLEGLAEFINEQYTLPFATANTVGGIIVGANLSITEAGVLSATDTDTTYDVMGSGNNYAAGLVLAGSATHNQTYLRKDGSWAIMDIGDLGNVSVDSPTDGHVLKWNATAGEWQASADLQGAGSGGGIELTDLSVTTDSASGGGSLSYASVSGTFTFAPADLSGLATSTEVGALNLNSLTDVNFSNPTANAVLKYNTSTSKWELGVDNNTTYSVMGSTNSYLEGLVKQGSAVHENEFLRKDGEWESISIENLSNVSGTVPSTGQVLKWSGTEWAPGTDLTTSGGSGISLTDLTVSVASAGTANLSYDNSSGTFTYTPPDLSNFATTSAIPSDLQDLSDVDTGTPAVGQIIKWDGNSWALSADETAAGIALTDLSVNTIASGATSLIYDNSTGVFTFTPPDLTSYLTSVAINDLTDVDTTGANVGSVLKYNGTSWVIGTDNNTGGGGGVDFTEFSAVTAAAGNTSLIYDDAGTFTYTPPDLSNYALNSNIPDNLSDLSDVSGAAPSDGQVLKWSTSNGHWYPGTDNTSSGGTGIQLTDLSVTTENASGNGNLSYDNTTGTFDFTPADLSGYATTASLNNLNLGDLNDVNASSPTNGQVIKWNGSAWASADDNATAYTLPTASNSVLGGVKVGNNLSIDSNGVLSAATSSYSSATSSTLGLVKLGNDTQQTVSANSISNTADRTYAVQFNSNDQLVVNVPWESGTLSNLTLNDFDNFYYDVATRSIYIADVPSGVLNTQNVNNLFFSNITLGHDAGRNLDNTKRAYYNTFIGEKAAYNVRGWEDGSYTTFDIPQGNVVVGSWSMYASRKAAFNVFIGNSVAGRLGIYDTDPNSSEHYQRNNVGIGQQAMHNLPFSEYNVAIGYGAMEGHQTYDASIKPYRNIAIGIHAGQYLTGGWNIALGNAALNHVSGNLNIAIGRNTLMGNSGISGIQGGNDGIGNIAIGDSTAFNFISGDDNIFIGRNNGNMIYYGSNNIIIGTAPNTGFGNTVNNNIVLGNNSISVFKCNVQTITSLSDKRDKKDIEPLTHGVDFINSLNPVKFIWDYRQESEQKGKKDIGFIAQELLEVDDEYTRLVYSEDPEELHASYGRLVPILVKAIQELKAEIDLLKQK